MITSPDNPRIKAFIRLWSSRHRSKSGLFIAEGVRQIQRALEAGLQLRDGFFCPSMLAQEPPEAAGKAGLEQVTERLMARIAYRENPQGIVAIFEQPKLDLDGLSRLLPPAVPRSSGPSGPPLLVVMVGSSKPGNLGAVLRSADAAGAHGVLVAEGRVDPFNPNAIRASTGAVFTVPVVTGDGPQIRRWLNEQRIQPVAADPTAACPHTKADLQGPLALVVGAEDTGLDETWRSWVHQRVNIPMRGRVVDSLNTSVAAAILLFEVIRQRTAQASDNP